MNKAEIIPHWLTKQASLHPEKVAIEQGDGTTLTFSELESRSKQFARQLTNLHITKGTRVAILSENNLDMIVAIHALSYLEAVVVLLNTRLTKHELLDQIKRSGTGVLLISKKLQKSKSLHFSAEYTFDSVKGMPLKDVLLAEEINLHAPFTMMYTSGTTGAPKGVIHTYGNHWWSAVGSALNLGVHENDKWLLTLPLFHVGGLSILIRSVMYGMTVYFIETYNVHAVKEALFEKKVTIASLVTLMLQQLVDEMDDESLPGYVRTILLGGGSVPEPLLRRVEKRRIPLFQSYGMTETSSQIVTLSASYARKKLGSAGKPLVPAQLMINEPDSEGIGEILVKGPMVFHGYDGEPEENETAFSAGWFYTGDLGYVDDEGFLYVVDRRTDLIISGGENIYPSEVEQVILDEPNITDVAVVGKKDEKWGEVPVAFIVAETAINLTKLKQNIAERLATYKVPKQFLIVETLPRNASNKIMRHLLAKKINNRTNNT